MSYSIESTMHDLLANSAAKAILDQYLPGLTSSPRISMAGGLSLSAVADRSGGRIPQEALQKINAALKALG